MKAGQPDHPQAPHADLVGVRHERLPLRPPAEHPAEDPQREPRHSAQARDQIDQSAAKVGDPAADGIQRTAGTRLCHSLTPHQNQRLERPVVRGRVARSSYAAAAPQDPCTGQTAVSPALPRGAVSSRLFIFVFRRAELRGLSRLLPVEASRELQGGFNINAL